MSEIATHIYWFITTENRVPSKNVCSSRALRTGCATSFSNSLDGAHFSWGLVGGRVLGWWILRSINYYLCNRRRGRFCLLPPHPVAEDTYNIKGNKSDGVAMSSIPCCVHAERGSCMRRHETRRLKRSELKCPTRSCPETRGKTKIESLIVHAAVEGHIIDLILVVSTRCLLPDYYNKAGDGDIKRCFPNSPD